MSKLKSKLFLAILAVVLSSSSMAESLAVENCENVGIEYRGALDEFQASSAPSNLRYKELVKLKKEADKLRETCVKTVNSEFKSALREINLKYSNQIGTREERLSLKTKKNNEIASATLVRDKRLRDLNVIPALPQKPIKNSKVQKP